MINFKVMTLQWKKLLLIDVLGFSGGLVKSFIYSILYSSLTTL